MNNIDTPSCGDGSFDVKQQRQAAPAWRQANGLEQANRVRHCVRSWTYLFAEMLEGAKSHDLRRDDRNYQVGDELQLEEYDHVKGRYTDRKALFLITHITGRNHTSCAVSSAVLDPAYVILSVKPWRG